MRRESALVTVPDPATNPVRREVRLSLPEKVAKSAAERAPVVVELESPREMPLHAIERPLAAPVMRLTLLLKVDQSLPVIAPVVVEFAVFIANTPVRLLYMRGPFAERDVREILLATTQESVFRLPERLNTVPESERIFPVAVAR